MPFAASSAEVWKTQNAPDVVFSTNGVVASQVLFVFICKPNGPGGLTKIFLHCQGVEKRHLFKNKGFHCFAEL